jgi:hypothetical protein
MTRPFEETDFELAAQIQLIVSGKHETIKALYQRGDDFVVVPKQFRIEKVGRNDLCRSEKLIESLQDSCFLPASKKQLRGRRHHEVLHFLHRL